VAIPILVYAERYISLGWYIFALANGKVPPGDCPRCEAERWDAEHDKEACGCLTCHGFYASTRDLGRLAAMLAALGTGAGLAVQCGALSKLVVLDFESHGDPAIMDAPTGLDIYDRWLDYYDFALPPTLAARSASGGIHLFYETAVSVSSGCIVPSTLDRQGALSYAALPSGRGNRQWIEPIRPIAPMPSAVADLPTVGRKRAASRNLGNNVQEVPTAGTGGKLPATSEFLEKGLGWWSGQRHWDARMLAFRMWGQRATGGTVKATLRACWDATPNQSGESWERIWGQAVSARAAKDAKDQARIDLARQFKEGKR
jgi:hypothetical protein